MYSTIDRNLRKCAICADPTNSKKETPLCRPCMTELATGRCHLDRVGPIVRDGLTAMFAYRVRLGVAALPTTVERRRWLVPWFRARLAYLNRHGGTLPPVVSVPHTTPAWLLRRIAARQQPPHSRDTIPAPGS